MQWKHFWGDGETTFWGLFPSSPVSLWKELRPSALVVHAFGCSVISLTLTPFTFTEFGFSHKTHWPTFTQLHFFLFLIIFYVLCAFYITLLRRNVYADLWLTYLFIFLTLLSLQFHFWLPCITGIVTHKLGDRRPVLWCPVKAQFMEALSTSSLKWLLIPLLT